MKTTVLLFFLLACSLSYGQVNMKKSGISTGGGSATAGNTTLTYAIGEVAVQENTQGNIHISEGFIGPDILSAVGIEDYTELSGVAVYPNPVETYLQIELPAEQDYEIYLFDLNGKQILQTGTNGSSTKQLNLEHLQTAVYMLIVVDRKNQKQKILKIQKN